MLTPLQQEAMLRRTGGVPVVSGAVSTWGHLDEANEEMFSEAPVQASLSVATVATGIIGTLEIDGAVTVDGVAYTIRGYQRLEDGGLTAIGLEEA